MSGIDGERTRVRGYELIDKELLASFGSGSGYLSVLVMAMYISSGEAEIHYSRHQLIGLICPLLLYWISYFWLMAHRGESFPGCDADSGRWTASAGPPASAAVSGGLRTDHRWHRPAFCR